MSRVKTSKSWEHETSKMTSFGEIKFDKNGVSQEITEDQAKALANASPSMHLCTDDGDVVLPEPIEVDISEKAIVAESDDSEQLQADLNNDDITSTGDDNVIETVVEEVEEVEEKESSVTAEDLDKLSMADIRELLLEVDGVSEADLDEFKGKPSKSALIEFAMSKL